MHDSPSGAFEDDEFNSQKEPTEWTGFRNLKKSTGNEDLPGDEFLLMIINAAHEMAMKGTGPGRPNQLMERINTNAHLETCFDLPSTTASDDATGADAL